MLIEFTVKNWKSFRDETKISLVAGNCLQNGRKLPEVCDYDLKLLPIAAIYGGNAAGKTNFVEAFKFAQNIVLNGTEIDGDISVEPFLKDDESVNLTSNFMFKLLIGETFYDYRFSVNRSSVIGEELSEISTKGGKKLFFERKRDKIVIGTDFIDESLQSIKNFTREEQLFLSNTMTLNINVFRPVYDWFKHSLRIIRPDKQYQTLLGAIDRNDTLLEDLNEVLYYFHTGISKIENQKLKPEVAETLLEGQNDGDLRNRNINLSVKNGKPEASRLVSKYLTPSGKSVIFPLQKESEGTRRLIDLLPTFFDLTSNSELAVLVVDEVDRSLHSHLTKSLILSYLRTTDVNTRTQLVFTTHDLSLLEPEILRRDETWISERDIAGVTHLFSLDEFKDIPKNVNIREKYESGILGGIPNLLYKNGNVNPFIKNRN